MVSQISSQSSKYSIGGNQLSSRAMHFTGVKVGLSDAQCCRRVWKTLRKDI